jgi:hypothetical protein
MNPVNGESNQDFLNRVAEALGEHFDCVQIFTQIDTHESTAPFSAGIGNIFARVKQAEMFVDRFNEIQFVVELNEEEEDEDE